MSEHTDTDDRCRSFRIILVAYVAALAAAGATIVYCGLARPLLCLAAADLVATLVIFGVSMAVRNGSVYDAYWSVLPPFVVLYWAAIETGTAPALRQVVVAILVFTWAVRLTWNWARGWAGLGHEDWRYLELYESAPVPKWLVSLFGVHLFPTVQVWLGCLALAPAIAYGNRPFGVLDAVALVVTGGAIAIEAVADEQLRAFAAHKQPGEIMTRGLWAWSRHPNYFGELSFWWGLWLFGVAADPHAWWTVFGPLSMTVMFRFASIPMLDRRSLARRPGYAEHMRRVSAIVPWFPRAGNAN